jgi:hypothetical protein
MSLLAWNDITISTAHVRHADALSLDRDARARDRSCRHRRDVLLDRHTDWIVDSAHRLRQLSSTAYSVSANAAPRVSATYAASSRLPSAKCGGKS